MYDTIALMVPTYKRHKDRLPRLIKSAYDNAESAIRFIFCVNQKDVDTLSFLKETKWPDDFRADAVIENSPLPDLSLYFNMMYDSLGSDLEHTVVTMLGDDMVFQTEGYDKTILQRVNAARGFGVWFADDDYIAHDRCCVNLFTTSAVVNATRLPFMCPFYKADMIDVVWWEFGRITGLLNYMPDIVIKHEHSSAYQGRCMDNTFKRLSPLQRAANTPSMFNAGLTYARMAAMNAINAGVGSWHE
jgi:hypothetical protein